MKKLHRRFKNKFSNECSKYESQRLKLIQRAKDKKMCRGNGYLWIKSKKRIELVMEANELQRRINANLKLFPTQDLDAKVIDMDSGEIFLV